MDAHCRMNRSGAGRPCPGRRPEGGV